MTIVKFGYIYILFKLVDLLDTVSYKNVLVKFSLNILSAFHSPEEK